MSGVPESGVPPSLKLAGTGGTGLWYFGPTMQPVSARMLRTIAARGNMLIPLLAGRRRLHRHMHAVGERIGRIRDNSVGGPHSGQDFDRVAEVMPQRDTSKLDPALAVHHTHLRAVRLEEDGAGGQHERDSIDRKLEVNVRVGAWQQLTGWIRDIELDC